ncbi:MAG TPA: metal ABC transporter permease [Acidimicrobiales bacterium]|nr:metal ABC transporter permease [Acidimicrobiales bacterium]
MNHLAIASANPTISWKLWTDINQILAFHFMVNALRAATAAAVVAGVVGWFMVLRRQTFAGHTLSLIAFPGAAGATWLGISALWGYFGFCIVGALIIGAATDQDRRSLSNETAVIGVVQAFGLACGFLFVMLSKGFLNETVSLLFGTFLGVTDHQVIVLVCVAAAAVLATASFGRRLLFTSVDPAVAAARGVPARLTGTVFLLVLGIAVAEISQITGALLVFALLVMPAAASQQMTARPLGGMLLSVLLSVVIAWVGVGLSYYYSDYPTGFFVTTVGFAVYVASIAGHTVAERKRRRFDVPAALSPA